MFRLSEELLFHCEKYNIIIWPVNENLLGAVKYQTIIPKDNITQFGMYDVDKNQLINSFQITDRQTIMSLKENCIYLTNLKNKTLGSIKISFFELNDLFSLQKSLFLGHTIYLPNEFQKICDSVPKSIDIFSTDFPGPFCKPIPKYNITNFEELTNLIDNLKVPIIINKCHFLSCSENDYHQFILNQSRKIYGYRSSITWEKIVENAETAWKLFLDNKLDFNIVDSPIDDKSILDDKWKKYAIDKLGDNYDFSLTWILTNAPKVTHFHVDPEYAGGYMKLLRGEKIWWCVAPADLSYLIEKGYTIEKISEMTISQIIQLENYYLWGKIFTDKITDGDFIWFPINCLHKVITVKSSYGFGGYI